MDTEEVGPVDVAPEVEEITPSCGPEPAVGDLFITEIMADPAGVDHNGANGYSSSEDEYIEVVNLTDESLDLSGVIVRSSGAGEFTLYDGCLAGKTGLLIFGGGTNALADIDKAIITESPSLNLDNEELDDGNQTTVALVLVGDDGEEVTLHDHTYDVALEGQSFAWDFQNAAWVAHSLHPDIAVDDTQEPAPEPAALFSPGTCPDGSPMPFCL